MFEFSFSIKIFSRWIGLRSGLVSKECPTQTGGGARTKFLFKVLTTFYALKKEKKANTQRK